jgi:hypothetical protein
MFHGRFKSGAFMSPSAEENGITLDWNPQQAAPEGPAEIIDIQPREKDDAACRGKVLFQQ